MSDIEFNCLSCNQSLSVDESGAGMEVQCPGCGQSVTVPQASQPTQKPRLALKKSCPSCGNAVQYDDVICVNCGTNLKTGANLQTAVGRNKQQPVSQSGSQSLRQFKYEAMDQNGCTTEFFHQAANGRVALRAACSLSRCFQNSSSRRLA